MHFAQHYIDCLSQASYVVGDTTTGQAVVVDPRRDIQDYLDDAAENGLTIVGVINTHFHADFLSGHLEMAAATGAWIGYGSKAETDFEMKPLHDGERIELGGPDGVVLQIMHTPGHTPESVSVLVYEKGTDEVPYGVLTGDALFIGDVGRPDLLASFGVTAEELGHMLYDSVQNKLMGLADAVRVFPAHGAGSACGKNLSEELSSTIGEQRRFNYACQPMSQEKFIELVTAGQPAAPEYFAYDAVLNRRQRETFTTTDVPRMDLAQAQAAVAEGAILLDVRDNDAFIGGHLRGAVSIPLDGRFAETSGMLLQPDDRIVVITSAEDRDEAVTRLARIGFDHVVGYLPDVEELMLTMDDGDLAKGSRLTTARFDDIRSTEGDAVVVVDVRNPGEVEGGTLSDVLTIPLAELRRRLDEVPRDRSVVLYCAGGWRSAVAASYLRSQGYNDVSDLLGGYEAWTLIHEMATA